MPAVYAGFNVHDGSPGTLISGSMAPGAATVKTPGLRFWRTQRLMLQEELAKRANVAVISIRRGENGQPLRVMTVRALADALQVDPADLMAQPPTE